MNVLADSSICLVGINYAPELTGIGPYTSAMATALKEAGAAVHVVTGVPHYPQWSVEDSRYESGRYWYDEVDGVRITRCAHHVPAQPNMAGRARMESSFLRRALPVVRRDDSTAIIAVTPSLSGLAAAVLGRRRRPVGAVVQDLTGNAAGESGSSGQHAALGIAKAEYSLLARCSRLGVITPRFGEVLAAQGIDVNRVSQLPNFSHVRRANVQAVEARRRLGWPERAFTVVHTGNMGRKQGLECAIAAAREAQRRNVDVNVVLVGDGNQRRELEEMAAGLPNVIFVKPLDAQLYPLSLAAADVLLVSERPGVKEMSLPSKLTSYTAAGRPIVAAIDSDGITREQLDQFSAALATPAGDGVALLDAILRLRDSPRLVSELTRCAVLMHHTAYGQEGAYRRYVEFARSLLHPGQPARTELRTIPGQRDAGTPRPSVARAVADESAR